MLLQMLFRNHPIEIVVVVVEIVVVVVVVVVLLLLLPARAAIGDSPPQYNINTQQRL